MGELVAGQPALHIETVVSLPLDLVSVLSLLHRATPDSGLDPWLVEARGRLPDAVREELDLLHGFSGRLLYFPEEPVMRFEPLRADRREAGFDDLLTFMNALPDAEFLAMTAHALERVYYDRELRWRPPTDEAGWARALGLALTTARLDDVMPLIANPAELKRRTIALFVGVWDSVYRETRETELPLLREAARQEARFADRGFEETYAALTGQRVPEVLQRPPPTIRRIAFCPSAHLGAFVSYIAYAPDLIVYFAAPPFLARCQERETSIPLVATADGSLPGQASDLLEATRALADPTRLRMLDVLLDGELYAQEIVARLGVAQSAASRHLAQLERAGLLTVEARRGSKYYAVNPERLDAVAAALMARGTKARARRE
jgi:DNA-binding transcriptional ArsR family regulator